LKERGERRWMTTTTEKEELSRRRRHCTIQARNRALKEGEA